MSNLPPTIPGLVQARYFDHGGNGDYNDPTAFWAYSPSIPRCGERVTTPSGAVRTVAQVIYVAIPIPAAAAAGSSFLMPNVVLDPNS